MISKLVILSFFFLGLWPLSYWLFLGRFTPNSDMHDFVTSDEFLMSVLDKPYDGCIALSYYDNVDIVIVGNSHASANIDLYELSELAGDKTVAVCALSAWNTDHFPSFFEFLDRYNLQPDTIIWLADESSALEFANVDRRQDFRDMVFTDQSFRNRVTREWMTENNRFEFLSLERYIERLYAMSKNISSLDNDIIDSVSKQDYIPHNDNIKTALSAAKAIPQHKQKLGTLCETLKRENINFLVFSSPLPPHTQNLMTTFIPSDLFDRSPSGLDYLVQNAECIDSVIDRPLEGWGLELKHFVNRTDIENYPYEIWKSVEGFEEPFMALEPRIQLRIYDPDHLNPVGAKIFTYELWLAVQDEAKRSQ